MNNMAKKEIEPLIRCEIEAFVENAKRFGFYEFFLLELQTGLMFGEIIAITWDDFDTLTNTIQINKIYQRIKGVGNLTSYKGTSNERTVRISKECAELLCNRRERLPKETELIFPSAHTRTYLCPETVRKVLKMICINANIPIRRFKDIQETYTSIEIS